MDAKTINQKVVELAGSQTEVANILGYSDLRNVHPWTSGKRLFPPLQCVKLEQHFKGAITRKELRPHDYAQIWPELA